MRLQTIIQGIQLLVGGPAVLAGKGLWGIRARPKEPICDEGSRRESILPL